MEISFEDLDSLYSSQICRYLVYFGPISGFGCNFMLQLSKWRQRVEVVPNIPFSKKIRTQNNFFIMIGKKWKSVSKIWINFILYKYADI